MGIFSRKNKKQQSTEKEWETVIVPGNDEVIAAENDDTSPLRAAVYTNVPVDLPIEDSCKALWGSYSKISTFEAIEVFSRLRVEDCWGYIEEILCSNGNYEASAVVEILKNWGDEGKNRVRSIIHKGLKPKGKLVFLTAFPDEDIEILLDVFDELSDDDKKSSLNVIAKKKSKKGDALIGKLLHDDDWRMVMKTASSLGDNKRKDFLPVLCEVSENAEGILKQGLAEIIDYLEL